MPQCTFLTHLRQRLKRTFLIKICPLSVVFFVVVVVDVVVVNISQCTHLCQNHLTNISLLGTKHIWVKGIQVCSNEGPCPIPKGTITKLRKYIEEIKISSRTTEPLSTKLGTKHPRMKGIQVCSNEEQINSHIVNNVFFLLINVMI